MKREIMLAALISATWPLATACARDTSSGDFENIAEAAKGFPRQQTIYRLAKQLEKDHAGIYEECEYSYKMLPENYSQLYTEKSFKFLFETVTSKTETALTMSRQAMSEADEATARAILIEGRLALNKVRDAIRPFKHRIPEIIWRKQHPPRGPTSL